MKKIIEGQNKDCQFRFEIGFTHFKGQAPYFSITGETWELGKFKSDRNSLGCGALDISKYIPKLAHLDKYHLMSTEQPMHYVANSIYHASDRDHNGLLKGEKRQIKSGKTGLPCWQMVAIDKTTGEEIDLYRIEKTIDSLEKPQCNFEIDFRPWCRVGEGKEPNLEAARSSACWPDAKLEDFTKEKLEARLPELLKQFKKDILEAGIDWPKDSKCAK